MTEVQTKKQMVIYSAATVKFSDVRVMPIYLNKTKGFRLVKFTTRDGSPFRIQFSNKPGRIPNGFGIDTSQTGKTRMMFSVPCEIEYNNMKKFQEDLKVYAKKHKDTWWQYPVTDDQVDDNFANIVSDQKPKADGEGFWPGNMKTTIPLDDDGNLVKCQVVDSSGNNVSIHDLTGKYCKTVIVELSSVYFQKRFDWGVGPKTLRLVELEQTEEDEGEVDFLNFMKNKRERQTTDVQPTETVTVEPNEIECEVSTFKEVKGEKQTKRRKTAL
jgi:hypothetical protein